MSDDENFEECDEEEDVLAPKEPQITSDKLEERKAARALRIQRRQEALKKSEQPEEEVTDYVSTSEQSSGPVERITAGAAEELQRLLLEGQEKVSNIQVAADECEVLRRYTNKAKRDELLSEMEKEAQTAQQQYEQISDKWSPITELKDPLDIDDLMHQQKQRCDALMQQKNKLIQDLKEELTRVDESYEDDLRKQDRDIKEMSDRIEQQLNTMKLAYDAQLELMQAAIEVERHAAMQHSQKRWDALHRQADRQELESMEQKELQKDEFDVSMDAIAVAHQDKYRANRIQLEKLLQELQKELERLKALCLINGEKIDYNYQVLKKREEENVWVRSQQRRRLNMAHDAAAALRDRVRRAKDTAEAERVRAHAQALRAIQAVKDLQRKADHFAQVNASKYMGVWRMNARRCSMLVRDISLCEQKLSVLCLCAPTTYAAPPLPPMPMELQEGCSDVVKKTSDTEINSSSDEEPAADDPDNMMVAETKANLVSHILGLVADQSGFLVESRLLQLLHGRPRTSRHLCTLDAIFMALQVQKAHDIELLCEAFLRYAVCPICASSDTSTSDLPAQTHALGTESHESVTKKGSDRISKGSPGKTDRRSGAPSRRSSSPSLSRTTHITFGVTDSKMTHSDQQMMIEAGQIMQMCADSSLSDSVSVVSGAAASAGKRGTRGTRSVTVVDRLSLPSHDHVPPMQAANANTYLCSAGHPLEIEASCALTALRDFVSSFTPPDKRRLKALEAARKPPVAAGGWRALAAGAVQAYWAVLEQAVPVQRQRLWDGLLHALQDYLPILQDRHKLNVEVQKLRSRNAALRQLVRGSLPHLSSTAEAMPAIETRPTAERRGGVVTDRQLPPI